MGVLDIILNKRFLDPPPEEIPTKPAPPAADVVVDLEREGRMGKFLASTVIVETDQGLVLCDRAVAGAVRRLRPGQDFDAWYFGRMGLRVMRDMAVFDNVMRLAGKV